MKIEVPDELHGRISERVEETEFDSVESYVTFVLEEVVKRRPELEDSEAGRDEEREEKVRDNLRSLGYVE